jgi:probable phosphoglycerate mutase
MTGILMSEFHHLTIYVIRHGECEHNIAGRAAAQNDSPLTENGRAQARTNGMLLKSVVGDLPAFDFFASSLHRTCNTMELVREAAGLPPIGYIADRRLMEIDFGDHTWMTRDEIMRHAVPNPENDDWDFVRPGGESLRHVYDRVGRFLETLTRDSVIVTHYGPARMIHTHMLGVAPGSAAQWRPPHAGIMRLSGGVETFFGE